MQRNNFCDGKKGEDLGDPRFYNCISIFIYELHVHIGHRVIHLKYKSADS